MGGYVFYIHPGYGYLKKQNLSPPRGVDKGYYGMYRIPISVLLYATYVRGLNLLPVGNLHRDFISQPTPTLGARREKVAVPRRRDSSREYIYQFLELLGVARERVRFVRKVRRSQLSGYCDPRNWWM